MGPIMSNPALALMIKFDPDSAQDIGAAMRAEWEERKRANAEATTPDNYTTVRDDDTALILRREPQWLH